MGITNLYLEVEQYNSRSQIVTSVKTKPEKKHIEHLGDPVFRNILSSLNEENKDLAPKIAADYYLLAFRSIKVFHFEKGSRTKHIYFYRSHPFVQEFITIICWVYLLISFWEPSHRNDDSIAKDSKTFIF